MNQILLIAHAPLAQALKQCALHVFPDCDDRVFALDVQPDAAPEDTLASARAVLRGADLSRDTLVLTDVFGATPCNVVRRLIERVTETGSQAQVKALAGVNLPMLLRAVSYAGMPLDDMLERAMAGGAQGIMTVTCVPPQNQQWNHPDDSTSHHHQQ